MITFPMLILVVVPLAAGIESLIIKKENGRAISVLTGISVGGFLWNVYSDWTASPVSSIVLFVLAVGLLIRLGLVGKRIFLEGLITAVVTLALLLGAWQGLLSMMVNREVVSEVEVLNPDGNLGTALLVYHPGKSGYQKLITGAYSEGLVANGWRVEVATASREAPTDLSDYDLLVLSAPTYDWEPAKPIQRYLEGLGDLGGQPTVVIISAAGKTTESLPFLEDLVVKANGELVASYVLKTIVPNRVEYGIDDPEEIMFLGAKELQLP